MPVNAKLNHAAVMGGVASASSERVPCVDESGSLGRRPVSIVGIVTLALVAVVLEGGTPRAPSELSAKARTTEADPGGERARQALWQSARAVPPERQRLEQTLREVRRRLADLAPADEGVAEWRRLESEVSARLDRLSHASRLLPSRTEVADDSTLDAIEGGRIAGTVTDAASPTPNPLAGVYVDIYDASGTYVTSGYTDGAGQYLSYDGLPAGSYYARTWNPSGYRNELFEEIPCEPCSVTSGTPIAVTAGKTTAGIDFTLEEGGRIAGTVTDTASPTPNPLAGVYVDIYDASGAYVTYGYTDGAGQYVSYGGLPAGSYHARTWNSSGYVNELYDDIPCAPCPVTSGTPIAVTVGTTTGGIDFALEVGGRIAGTVTDTASPTPNPLAGISVWIYDATQSYVTSGYTDGSGQYLSDAGLPVGSYYARTWNSSGYVDELYDDIPCPASCTVTSGTPIAVTVGATTGGVDFALGVGGRIAGTVTDTASPTPNPLAGIYVEIYDASGAYAAYDYTDEAGQYLSAAVPTGSYYARTYNWSGHLNELYDGIPCPVSCSVTSGTPIAVTAGATTGGVDFALQEGGRIAGTVTDTASPTPNPLAGIYVEIYDASGGYAAYDYTDEAGQYLSDAGLPAGTYYVRTYNSFGYLNELYDGIPCPGSCPVTSGTPIAVTAGATTGGIDFALETGGRIAGTVTDTSPTPNPLAGIFVQIYDAAGAYVASSSTDGAGQYLSDAGLPVGNYYARTSNSSGYANELYDDIRCLSCSVTNGTPIAVTAGTTTGGVDFALSRGGTISGHVREEGTGALLSSANAWITDEFDGSIYWVGLDPSGFYSATVPPGQYRVWSSISDGVHVPELHQDMPWIWWPWGLTGTPVTVTADAVTTVDMDLAVGGRVRGRVMDVATGDGIPDVSVGFWLGWRWLAATTDANGDYELRGIPAGDYPLLTANSSGYIDEFYGGMPSTGGARAWDLPSVTVTHGSLVDEIDFELSRGGRIGGTVTDASSGDPLANVTVRIFNDVGYQVTTGMSGASGQYLSAAGLAPGTYYARTNNESGYINECFGDEICTTIATRNPLNPSVESLPIGGQPIEVTSTVTVAGVDFALQPGGRIAGVVRNSGGGGVGGAVIRIHDAGNRIVAEATALSTTGSTGQYLSKQGLPAGSYYVTARLDPYVAEVYLDTTCLGCDPNSGTAVVVSEGATTGGIDFALESGGRIAGRVTDVSTGRGFPVDVWVWDAGGTPLSQYDWAAGDFSGGYATVALPSGQYYVKTRNWTGYVDEAYDDTPCGLECDLSGATLVTVTAGRVTWDRDFVLQRGARIMGTVTNTSGQPLGGVGGGIYDAMGRSVAHLASDAEGHYSSMESLPDGTYYVTTVNEGHYVDEVWPDIPCAGACAPLSGTPVVISGGVDATGIDFELGTRTLAIDDVSVLEGDAATATASFTVTLSVASTETVTVQYATADGTATVADGDYLAASGTLTFLPGDTSEAIDVVVSGDLRYEVNETFSVELSGATRAAIGDGVGAGTIVNDDPPPTITGFTPTSGPVGAPVAITGTNFTGATAVAFNGMSASYTVDSGTSITATVPPGATTGPISVWTPGGAATSASSFTVVVLCTSFTISPTSVSVPYTSDSQIVTITGVPAGCGGGGWTTAGNGIWITVSPASGTGPGSATVDWTANPGFARYGDATIAGQTFTVVQGSPSTDYFTITPCRVLDTRLTSALTFGTAETFQIGGECGVSASATAVALNVTVVSATAAGNCRLYPDPSEVPLVSTINYTAGLTRANNAVVPLLSPLGTTTVRCVGAGGGTVHVILDVFGYFAVADGATE